MQREHSRLRTGVLPGLTDADLQRFSLSKLYLALDSGDWKDAGFEREVCKASEAAGVGLTRGNGAHSATVPIGVMLSRDLTVASATGGGNLVATEMGPLAGALYNQSIALRAGAQMLEGLVGNLAICPVTGSVTGYWLSDEATGPTESAPTVGKVTLSPKVAGAYVEASHKLLKMGGRVVEAMLSADLKRVVAQLLDTAVIAGTGADGQPTGILTTVGIGTFTGTSLALAGLVEAEADVALTSGALIDARMAWATTPTVAGVLKVRQRFAGSDRALWEGKLLAGEVEGSPAYASANVPASKILFGDWSTVAIGQGGVLEVEKNPYANFQAGIPGFRALMTCDVAVRQPGAFSAATGVT